jgi:hypothetical protein
MTYDRRDPGGVALRSAPAPWGPWTDEELIFRADRDGAAGKWLYVPGKSDAKLAGPVIGEGKDHPETVKGGAYAPYVISRFTTKKDDLASIYYVISTWNPYVVHLLRSQLRTLEE